MAETSGGREFGPECITLSDDGREIRCPAFPEPCEYVRIMDEDGNEAGYWTSDEWKESPEEVMGAILGCFHGQREEES